MTAVLRFLVLGLLAIQLAACTPRGKLSYAPMSEAASVSTVFIATTRQKGTMSEGFTGYRSPRLQYGRFSVSVPPTHQPGIIEWPAGKTDPRHDFVTVDADEFAGAAQFRSAVNQAAASLNNNRREAVVFVHGYNNNFAEGLYRITQLTHDLDVDAVKILYSWPSAGKAGGYVYDRDSAMYSRDGLQELLENLAKTNLRRVYLVAHSMGAQLSMETLRQMYIAGQPSIRPKLGGVILMSPDIDLDVFKSQLRRIRPIPKPFVIFSSRRDYALRLSSLITGERQRLGNLSNVSELEEFEVLVVDISDFQDGQDRLNHSSYATSPTILRLMRSLPELDRRLTPDNLSIPGQVEFKQNATWVVPNTVSD